MTLEQRLKDIKLKRVLTFSFSLLLVMILILGALSIRDTRMIAQSTETLYNRPHTNLVGMWQVKTEIAEIGSGLRNWMLTGTPLSDEEAKAIGQIEAKMRAIEGNKVDKAAAMSDNMKAILSAIQAWQSKAQEIQGILSAGGVISPQQAAEFAEIEATVSNQVDSVIATASGNALKFKQNALESAQSSLRSFIVVVVIAVLLTLLLLAVSFVKISRPMEILLRSAQEIKAGHFDSEVPYYAANEFGQLAEVFRQMQATLQAVVKDMTANLTAISAGDFRVSVQSDYVGDFTSIEEALHGIGQRLSQTMSQINQAADQVASGSDQVASGAQFLSQGATEQASAIEELAATISEVSVQIERNAASAAAASTQAQATAAEMNSGRGQMQQMQQAMNEINGLSNEIIRVIKTIDDIAFQTNILALNAAVEAARAGAAGKGFAVVADEVRNLAVKSSEASQNTAELLENAITAIKDGTSIANRTEESFQQIMAATEKSNLLLEEINQASKEQAGAISQVTLGIEQISTVVQNNSATAEESAAASAELNGQAQTLKQLVAEFKLDL